LVDTFGKLLSEREGVEWVRDGVNSPMSSSERRVAEADREDALVTGSTDGVGRLVARRLGEAGARVLVHGRDAERGARVVAEIEKAGGGATFLKADLASLADVRRLASAVQDATDRLDILTNNAGIGTAGGVRQELR
jgi:NAD(P)-dependent dehydrogenase (short-subunit alcohol dehydrogenase family)